MSATSQAHLAHMTLPATWEALVYTTDNVPDAQKSFLATTSSMHI